MARNESNAQVLADFFNRQDWVAAAASRPPTLRERERRITLRQRLGCLTVASVGVVAFGFAADRALDNLADRQSPPAGFDTDHRPTVDEVIENARTEGDVSQAELSQIVEDFYEQR